MAVSDDAGVISGRSCLNKGTIFTFWSLGWASASTNRSGQTITPVSQLQTRTSPLAFGTAPHACVERFADVTIAQSMESIVSAFEKRMYVFMCGAARRRPASRLTAVASRSPAHWQRCGCIYCSCFCCDALCSFMWIDPPEPYPLRDRRISSGVGKMMEYFGGVDGDVEVGHRDSKRTSFIHFLVWPRLAMEDIYKCWSITS